MKFNAPQNGSAPPNLKRTASHQYYAWPGKAGSHQAIPTTRNPVYRQTKND